MPTLPREIYKIKHKAVQWRTWVGQKGSGGAPSLHVLVGHIYIYIIYTYYIYICIYILEKAMAPHSSTLAWKFPWTEEPGRLLSMGSLTVGQD